MVFYIASVSFAITVHGLGNLFNVRSSDSLFSVIYNPFFLPFYDAHGTAVVLRVVWLAVLRFVTVLALIIRPCARELSRRGWKSEEPKLKSIPRPAHRREFAWLSALNARRRGCVFTEHRGNHNFENTRVPRRGVYHGESPSRRIATPREKLRALPCYSRQVHMKHIVRNLTSERGFSSTAVDTLDD